MEVLVWSSAAVDPETFESVMKTNLHWALAALQLFYCFDGLLQHLNVHVWVTSAERLLCKFKRQEWLGESGGGVGGGVTQSYNISSERTFPLHIYDLHS